MKIQAELLIRTLSADKKDGRRDIGSPKILRLKSYRFHTVPNEFFINSLYTCAKNAQFKSATAHSHYLAVFCSYPSATKISTRPRRYTTPPAGRLDSIRHAKSKQRPRQTSIETSKASVNYSIGSRTKDVCTLTRTVPPPDGVET